MATRVITHFKVGTKLFNDIANVLNNLPASVSRDLLNRIENGEECEPMFKVELQPKKPPKTPRKKPARRKAAKKKRRERRTKK